MSAESRNHSSQNLFESVLESLPETARHRKAWLALLRCFSSIERVLMQHFSQEFNSSIPRYDVLTALVLTDRGLTMGELASMLMVTKGNITGVVKRLQQERLVKKVTSKEDARIQLVTISPRGRKLWDTMHADYDRIISELLSGQSGAQLQELTLALDQTRASVEKNRGESQENRP
jgi:DNA-binding MarR family transcriptional regulator